MVFYEKTVLSEKVKLPLPGTTRTGQGTIEIGDGVKLSALAPAIGASSMRMIKMYFVMIVSFIIIPCLSQGRNGPDHYTVPAVFPFLLSVLRRWIHIRVDRKGCASP